MWHTHKDATILRINCQTFYSSLSQIAHSPAGDLIPYICKFGEIPPVFTLFTAHNDKQLQSAWLWLQCSCLHRLAFYSHFKWILYSLWRNYSDCVLDSKHCQNIADLYSSTVLCAVSFVLCKCTTTHTCSCACGWRYTHSCQWFHSIPLIYRWR